MNASSNSVTTRQNAFVYIAQIPTGEARTHGYGKTCNVYVIRCDKPENFKTLNSLTINKVGTWKRWYVGQARFDYGLKRGASRRLLDNAKKLCYMVANPEPRTTREEF